jgi:diguanylate cyclase (GGDEF)-like protein/PAS domain S-box-containing protein
MNAGIETEEKNCPSGPQTFLKKWMGDWGGKLLALFTVVVGVYILYLFYSWGGEVYRVPISNIVSIVVFIGPAIMAWRASRHPAISSRSRLGWRFISLANISFSIGSVLWLYYESVLGEQPFPSGADAGYLLFYPLMLAGLLLLVEKMRSAEERLNFTLDASVIMIGGGIVLWYFLLGPIARAGDDDTLKTALSLAYPIGDLVLLLGISSLLLRRAEFTSRRPINLLLTGLVVNFAYDFIFGYQNLAGTYVSGSPVEALFSVPSIPLMLAAHMYYVGASEKSFETAPAQTATPRFFWVPYLVVAVVYLLLLKVAFEPESGFVVDAILVAGTVTALVIFRQFMFVRENTKANLALTDMQERIQGIYSASTDAIGLADFTGTINEVNDSFLHLTGYKRDEIVGMMNYHDFVPDDYLELSDPPQMAIRDKRPIEYERVLVRKDGVLRNVTTTLYAVNGRDGVPAAMAVVIRDITDRRLLEQQLTHQALHDPLTGLANRVLLGERVTTALKRAHRKRSNVAVLFLDLDNFKTVNDTLGHGAGDSLLITVAERLRSCLRASDMPARLGGDEFAILIEDVEHPGEEISVADRIMTAIRTPMEINGKEVFVGVSIGIAVSSASTEDPEDLLRNADVAMYKAKKEGKNRYTIYQDIMRAEVIHRAQLETELRTAILKKEFQLHYQPILDLSSGTVVAMETLLRWDHPRKIKISPGEFIPIAEETNLIKELGQWVLEEACGQAARWQQEYCPMNPFALSVNISGRQFADSEFVQTLEAAYGSAGLSPHNLILEITESTMLINTAATIEKLKAIRQLGVKLAVDDFGTGFSSLSYLHKFPIDVLKIDLSFVEKISDGKEGAAMARAIISMGETLGFTTIAEGIEKLDQIETLRNLGCNWGQGYYFAKPLDVRDMETFLEKAYVQNTFVLMKNKGIAGMSNSGLLASTVP